MQLRTLGILFTLVTGVLAVVWPALPWHLLLRGQAGATCPLGFGGGEGLPSPHFGAKSSSSRLAPETLVLYVNATVWTGQAAAAREQAFAVHTATGRFAYVGSSDLAPGAAQVVDLGGAHVVPGLVDSHLHLIGGGLSLSRLDLSTAASQQQLIDAVAAASRHLAPGTWLLGGGWDESRWGGQLPSAAWIDQVAPTTPVWLVRFDSHMGLANSAALRLASITADTPDPPGGTIRRDASGQPTGLLTDAAMQLLADHIPPLTIQERRRAFEAAVQHALSKGITMVHCMGRVAFMEGEEAAWEDLEEIYLPAANEGRLPLRLYAFVPLTTWKVKLPPGPARLQALRSRFGAALHGRRMAERVQQLGRAHPSGMLFWGGVKEFADGSLGSRTALFHEPYADQPGNSGTRTIELGRLRELVAAADAAGLQVAVHAIGDRAVDEVLAIYEDVAANRSRGSDGGSSRSSATRRRRHRIEHAQHLSSPGVARRLAAAGVVATPNPLHLLADMPVLEQRLGRERAGAGRTYAFRTLQEAGAISAFGSDWPVVPLEPLAGTIYAAVHRQAPGAAGGSSGPWAPEEALTVEDALSAHTLAGAAAAGLEAELGSIAVSKLADFVVLGSGAPGDAAPAVRQTFVGGKCVYGCDA